MEKMFNFFDNKVEWIESKIKTMLKKEGFENRGDNDLFFIVNTPCIKN